MTPGLRRATRVALVCAAVGAILLLSKNPIRDTLSWVVSDRGVNVVRDQSYGAHPRQKLDIYSPAKACPDGPIVVFWYGGAWTRGDRAAYAFAGAALAARGITTVVPDYRLYSEVRFPAFIEDAAAAYAWSVRHLAGAGSGQRAVFVMGHSAGAHIAALLAYDENYIRQAGAGLPRPKGLIGLAGPYAFDPTTWASTKDIFATASTADSARPVAFVRPGAPPSLLLHGAADTTVRLFNTRDTVAALKKSGTPVETAEYPDIGHVGLILTLAAPLRWRAPTLNAVVSFVERTAAPEGQRRAACSPVQIPP
jgi:acetyl esterase/lipase